MPGGEEAGKLGQKRLLVHLVGAHVDVEHDRACGQLLLGKVEGCREDALLELCRELFRQFVSKILRDKYLYDEKQMYFDTHAIPNQEIGRYYLSGMTGLHFTLYVQEPIDLIYDDEQWT